MGESITIDNDRWFPPAFNDELPDIIDETLPSGLAEERLHRLNSVSRAAGDVTVGQSVNLASPLQKTEIDDALFEYNPSKDEVLLRYPDLEFSFNHKWLFRSGVVEPSLESRTRAVLYAAREASELNEFTDSLKWPDSGELEKQAKAALNSSKKEVTIATNMKVKQAQFLPFESALKIVHNRFVRENHPIYQAIHSLAEQFSPDDIPASIVHQIERTLYSGIAYEEIKDIYQRALKKEKEAHKLS
jgi:hypothetical protein